MDTTKPLDGWSRSGVKSAAAKVLDKTKSGEVAGILVSRPSVSPQLPTSDWRGIMDQEAAKPKPRAWRVLASADVKTWGKEDPELRPLFRQLVEDALARDPQALRHLLIVLLPTLEANAAKVHRRHAGWYEPGELRNEYFALLVVGLPLGVYARRRRKAAHNDPPPTPALAYWLADSAHSFSDFAWIVLAHRTNSLNRRLDRRGDFEIRDADDLNENYAEPNGGSHNWSPEDLARSANAALTVSQCLGELSERNRRMLSEVFNGDQPLQEIAGTHGVKPSTLSNIVRDFRARVEGLLELPIRPKK